MFPQLVVKRNSVQRRKKRKKKEKKRKANPTKSNKKKNKTTCPPGVFLRLHNKSLGRVLEPWPPVCVGGGVGGYGGLSTSSAAPALRGEARGDPILPLGAQPHVPIPSHQPHCELRAGAACGTGRGAKRGRYHRAPHAQGHLRHPVPILPPSPSCPARPGGAVPVEAALALAPHGQGACVSGAGRAGASRSCARVLPPCLLTCALRAPV